jgi:cysteinyl-tRNA synthetase
MPTPVLTIHDTLTGTKRPFEPIVPGEVKLYVCGVTVYDYAHIGHGRTFMTFDTVVRYLRHRGFTVTFVRNHTDIDDKIIHRAAERGEDPVTLAERFIAALDEDAARLGLVAPDIAPRVTQTMPEILGMIERLIERGHAYAAGGDVYYAVESFADYGKLAHRRLDDMRAGERVAVDERKRNPFDFALWKAAKPGEPSWDSPWGPGRPGWHIECSAMSKKYLGVTFDIHGGGSDLQFPHHENEIAQSEGASGCTLANWWMHSAMLNIDGEKMSKSLGNFWTLRDVLDQHHAETIRYFFLTAHYRKAVNYSHQNLEAARERVRYLHKARRGVAAALAGVDAPAAPDRVALTGWLQRLHEAMDDDFNTPVALAVIQEAARNANEMLATRKLAKQPEVLARLAAIASFLDTVAEVFGVLAHDSSQTLLALRRQIAAQQGVDEGWVVERIAARRLAREARDFAASDAIRDELTARGVEIMDTPSGTEWDMAPRSDSADAEAT